MTHHEESKLFLRNIAVQVWRSLSAAEQEYIDEEDIWAVLIAIIPWNSAPPIDSPILPDIEKRFGR